MTRFWADAICSMENQIIYHFTPSIIAKSAFFYIQSLGYFICDEYYYTKREGYNSYLLIYTISGKGYAKYRGKNYEINKGQVLILNCYDYHEYSTDKTNLWEMKWIHFNGSTSSEYYNIIYNKFGPLISIFERHHILEYLDEIERLIEANDFQFEVRISRLIVDILSELLLSKVEKTHELSLKQMNEKSLAAIAYIERNFERHISLKDMAYASCSSKYHFSRVFKHETGYSPYEYLIKYRINKAKSLLKTSMISIEEISDRLGFCSYSNFIKTFKSIEDITPLKYRKYWMNIPSGVAPENWTSFNVSKK